MSINAGTVVGYLELDASKFKSGLNTAMEQLKGFTDKSNSAGTRFQALGSSLKTIGSNMSKYVTLPLAGIGTASVATAANFEKSMSQVAATMGMTAEEINNGSESYKKLEQAALDMGATTQFSASEASEALNYLALAGYDVDKSVSTLPTVLNLAAAGGLELGYASDVMTDAMSALSLETSQAELFVDQLAKTSQKSNTNVAQLGEAILTVGGTAKVLSGGTTELNTALGILADNGIKGAEGGTALRNIILALTPSTDKAVAAFKKLGVETYDANGNLRPINETFAEMEGKLKNLSQEERTRVLSDIFNKTDLKSVNALLANSGERFDELSGYIDNASGAAADMADTMNNNLSGQLTLLKSGLEGAAISIGNSLMPVIKVLVEWINNLVTWFNNLNPGIQTAITIFGLVVAAIGPVLLIVGQLCIAIGGLITFFGAGGAGAGILSAAIAAITGPVGLVIAAVTALIAIGVLLYKNWDEIKAKCGEIWSYICDVVSEFVSKSIQWLKDKWEEGKQWLIDCWGNVKQGAIDIWNSIGDFFSETIPKWIDNIGQWFDELPYKIGYALGSALRNIIDWGASAWDYLETNVPKWIEGISNWFKELPGKIWEWLSNAIQKIAEWGKQTYQKAKESARETINVVGEWFSQLPGKIWQWLTQTIQKMSQWAKDMGKKAKEGASEVVKNVSNGIKELPSKVYSIGSDAVKSLWNGISSMGSWIKDKVSGFISGIVDGFKGVKSGISSAVGKSRFLDIPNITQKVNIIGETDYIGESYYTRNNVMDIAKEMKYAKDATKASISESIERAVNSSSKSLSKGNIAKGSSSNNVTINNTYNSPKPASIRELKRQDEIQMRRLAMQLGF